MSDVFSCYWFSYCKDNTNFLILQAFGQFFCEIIIIFYIRQQPPFVDGCYQTVVLDFVIYIIVEIFFKLLELLCPRLAVVYL